MICKACKADALIHVARYGNMPKNIECPHGVCWCEQPAPEKRLQLHDYITDRYGLGNYQMRGAEVAKFCPICGKKLED